MSGRKVNHLKSSRMLFDTKRSLPFHPERGPFRADWVGRWHQPHLIISDGGVTEMTTKLLNVFVNPLPPRLTPPSPLLPLPEYHHHHELPTKARRRMLEASPDGSVLSIHTSSIIVWCTGATVRDQHRPQDGPFGPEPLDTYRLLNFDWYCPFGTVTDSCCHCPPADLFAPSITCTTCH